MAGEIPEPIVGTRAALEFELALGELINEHLQGPLTVTEAIGTLQLQQLEIFRQWTELNTQ